MKVRELLSTLMDLPQDAIVVMSSDGEGNSYSPLSDVIRDHVYAADSTWSGEIGFAKMTPELEADGYGEEDLLDGVPCVVLYPTN